MNHKKPGQIKVWTPLLFSLILILGMIMGFQLRDTLRQKRDIFTIVHRNDRLEQIIDLIKEKYVDSVDGNLLYEDAINGILSHLDPHTVYFRPEDYAEVNEGLEGSFFGIGLEFIMNRDTIQVTATIADGPAEKAGVKVGDQLIRVEDSLVAGNHMNARRIMQMLKGKKDSEINLDWRDPSTGAVRSLMVQRDAIPLYSLDAGLMLDSVTGYIRIGRFSATTYQEFMRSLAELKAKGARHLLLDLRDNPGGYLEAASQIADELLDGDKLITYTEGKSMSRKEYRSRRAGLFESGRLVVLVNEHTASAAEVLAGAVQDWDRGVVIGRRTYGKGLVQEQYDMDDGSGLRLTVARYYTPSGRSIQKPYARETSPTEAQVVEHFESGDWIGADTVEIVEDTTAFYTASGRVVYGGGGIVPDLIVPVDSQRFSSGLLNMLMSENLRNLVLDYYLTHKEDWKKYPDVETFNRTFDARKLLDAYLSTLDSRIRSVAAFVLMEKGNAEYFGNQMKALLARLLFRDSGYYRIQTIDDIMVQRARELVHDSSYSVIIGR